MSAPWGFGECVQFSEINHMAKNQCSSLQLSPAEGHSLSLPSFQESLPPQPTSSSVGPGVSNFMLSLNARLGLFPADTGPHNGSDTKGLLRLHIKTYFFISNACFLARFLLGSWAPYSLAPLLDSNFSAPLPSIPQLWFV